MLWLTRQWPASGWDPQTLRWSSEQTGIDADLLALAVIDSKRVYAVGKNGTLVVHRQAMLHLYPLVRVPAAHKMFWFERVCLVQLMCNFCIFFWSIIKFNKKNTQISDIEKVDDPLIRP